MPDCVTLSLYYWLYYNNLLVWAIKRQILSALIYTRGFPAIFRPRKQKMKLQSVWSFPPLVSVIACFWPCWPSPVGIVFVSPNFAITTFSLPARFDRYIGCSCICIWIPLWARPPFSTSLLCGPWSMVAL